MEIHKRGWRDELTAWTKDTTGQSMPIGEGPSAILKPAVGDNIAAVIQALDDARQAGR